MMTLELVFFFLQEEKMVLWLACFLQREEKNLSCGIFREIHCFEIGTLIVIRGGGGRRKEKEERETASESDRTNFSITEEEGGGSQFQLPPLPLSALPWDLEGRRKSVAETAQPPTVACKIEAQSEHIHVGYTLFARLSPICMLRRCLLTKFLHRSSGGSLSRLPCWLGGRAGSRRGVTAKSSIFSDFPTNTHRILLLLPTVLFFHVGN